MKLFKKKNEKEEKREKLESDLRVHEGTLNVYRIALIDVYENLVKEFDDISKGGENIMMDSDQWELRKTKIAKYKKMVIDCEHDVDRIKRELEEL